MERTGISAESLPHILERFYQSENTVGQNRQGMGLGLGIVHHLVQLDGGTVRAQSPGEGMGATFTLILPVPSTEPVS